MDKFGSLIRLKREEKGMLLRQVSAKLDVDTALMSKIERGERAAKKELVAKLARILAIDKEELMALWLADKIAMIIDNESQAERALNIALTQLKN